MNSAVLDALYSGMPKRPDDSVVVEHFFGSDVYVRKSFVPRGQVVRMHVHPYDHLAIIGAGCGRLMMADEPVRTVKNGDVIEINRGMKHAYIADADTIFLCVHGLSEAEARALYAR